MTEHSDYIVFVDESGDHGLEKINPQFPIFVLAFCIIRKSDYADLIVPSLKRFKFRWFGHDLPILHEMDIVKKKGDFSFLQNSKLFSTFMEDLTQIISDAPITIISCVIDKRQLGQRYKYPMNPYDIALLFCLERSRDYLCEANSDAALTHIIVESRSPKQSGFGREDKALFETFDQIIKGNHGLQRDRKMARFQLHFAGKQSNSIGLQLVDLIARPLGLSVLRPDQPNRAFDVIKSKIWKYEDVGKGLKLFP